MLDSRSSLTSDLVAALRALYSDRSADFDVVGDPIAIELLPLPLSWLLRGVHAVPSGPRVAQRLVGSVTLGLSYCVPLRTAAIDAEVREQTVAGTRQLVVLGAGLDARAWRLPELAETVVYELDHPATAAAKLAKTRALSPVCRSLRRCTIDFETEEPAAVLERAGFDAAERSIWIWEGVTMYLSRAALASTLASVAACSAPGSVLLCTYLPSDFAAHLPPLLTRAALGLFHLAGEPVTEPHSPAAMAALLAEHGFTVRADTGAREWAARWWPARVAKRAHGYERLVVAVRR